MEVQRPGGEVVQAVPAATAADVAFSGIGEDTTALVDHANSVAAESQAGGDAAAGEIQDGFVAAGDAYVEIAGAPGPGDRSAKAQRPAYKVHSSGVGDGGTDRATVTVGPVKGEIRPVGHRHRVSGYGAGRSAVADLQGADVDGSRSGVAGAPGKNERASPGLGKPAAAGNAGGDGSGNSVVHADDAFRSTKIENTGSRGAAEVYRVIGDKEQRPAGIGHGGAIGDGEVAAVDHQGIDGCAGAAGGRRLDVGIVPGTAPARNAVVDELVGRVERTQSGDSVVSHKSIGVAGRGAEPACGGCRLADEERDNLGVLRSRRAKSIGPIAAVQRRGIADQRRGGTQE